MRPKKKSKFFSFIFAFCPGAAEMYTGFMRMGSSLLAIFMIVVALALFGSSEIFVCLGVIVYVFSFFHARNIANTDSAEFEAIEDRFIWEEFTGKSTFHVQSKTLRKWFAGILIFLGVTMIYEYWMDIVIGFIPERLWEELYPIFEGIPATIFAIALIIAGVILIKGKKRLIFSRSFMPVRMYIQTFTEDTAYSEPITKPKLHRCNEKGPDTDSMLFICISIGLCAGNQRHTDCLVSRICPRLENCSRGIWH